MTSANSSKTDDRFLANAMASFIQIGALLLLIIMCFLIVQPFISIVVWGVRVSLLRGVWFHIARLRSAWLSNQRWRQSTDRFFWTGNLITGAVYIIGHHRYRLLWIRRIGNVIHGQG